MVRWLHISCHFHDTQDSIGVVGSSKIEVYSKRIEVQGVGHTAVRDVRELDLKVHSVHRRVLVPHDDSGIRLGYKLRDTEAHQERVLCTGFAIVEEPHAVGVASNFTNSPDKIPGLVAGKEDTKVES